MLDVFFFFSSRRRHTRLQGDWSSDVCSSDLGRRMLEPVDDLQSRLAAALAGRYTVEREIGRGGMSIVYQARDLRNDRWLALKGLRPEGAGALGPDRFLREIKVAAGLTHPHILPP